MNIHGKRWTALLVATTLCITGGLSALAEDISPAAEAAQLAAQSDNPLINKVCIVLTDDQQIASQQDTINILLLGIDDQDKDYTYRNEMAHTDAMMVLSIDLSETRSGAMFNLLSIPRDTMAYVPAVKGVYKINGAINCGDALGAGVTRADDKAVVAESQAGFAAVCSTVSWLLGGIKIDYYCAVTMDAMAELGDVIGGIDFDLEMSFTGVNAKDQVTRYKKGMQHLDGAGIVAYIRARHNATVETGSDQARAGRQRDMMQAIMDKFIANKTLVFTVMKSLTDNKTVRNGFYTNVDAAATARFMTIGLSLLTDTSKLDMGDLFGSYSLDGSYRNAFGNWKFRFLDQANRIEVIKAVFGVDVPQLKYVTYDYAVWLYQTGFTAIRYLAVADEMRTFIQDNYNYQSEFSQPGETTIAGTGTLPLTDKQLMAIDEMDAAYLATLQSFLTAAEAVDTAALQGKSVKNSLTKNVESAYTHLLSAGNALAKLVGYPAGVGKNTKKVQWLSGVYMDEDPLINEIYVNFR
ncbi:MAG: LCP family protein [Eubacteriales bacterium]|nr:LCP family protein [Eubacteriales bacterium]